MAEEHGVRERFALVELENSDKFIVVSEEDLESVRRHPWWLNASGGASSKFVGSVHKLLGYHGEGLEADHINRDRLDNRRSNLRLVTRRMNMFNRGLYKNSSTRYKGVYPDKRIADPFWTSSMMSPDGKLRHLANDHDILYLATLWDARMAEAYGEYALTNFKVRDGIDYLYEDPTDEEIALSEQGIYVEPRLRTRILLSEPYDPKPQMNGVPV